MNVSRVSITAFLMVFSGFAGYTVGRFPATAARAADAKAPFTSGQLPKDVHPDSRNRLPLAKRDDLDELGRSLYDEVVSDPRSLAGLQGPGGIRLWSSKLYKATRATNQFLRFDSGIDRPLAELAILVTARELNHAFEWHAHEAAARAAGLDPAIIEVVRYRRAVQGVPEPQAAIIELGREAVGEHAVNPPPTPARTGSSDARSSLTWETSWANTRRPQFC